MVREGAEAPVTELQPVFGNPIQVPHPSGRTVALLFVEDIRRPSGREVLERTQAAVREAELKDVDLVVLCRTPLEQARDLVPRHHLLFPVVCDPEGRIFEAWGLERATAPSVLQGLGSLPRTLPVLARHLPARPGVCGYLGALFVVDGAGRVARIHRLRWPWDLPDWSAVLARVAGSFP